MKHLIKNKKKAQVQRRFLDFNHIEQGVETDSYMTQPGYGHPKPSGKVFLDNTGQGINVDVADEFWNKSEHMQPDYPIGENSKPKGYHGPHNEHGRRKMPVRTIDNTKPPKVVPR